MIRIAICDDDSIYLDMTTNLLDMYQLRCPDIKIEAARFDSPTSLLDHLNNNNSFDIYLLDIVMPELSGIELAAEIRKYDEYASFIFLTSSTEYALEAFSVSAVSYILKPIDCDRLFPVLDKIIASYIIEDNSFILVDSSDGGIVKTLYSSIVAVESIGRSLCYYLTSGDKLESKMIRTPFIEAVSPLLSDSRFLNVHQSFVINMDHVQKLDTMAFIMKNNIIIPIPKPKYTDIKNKYFIYLAQSRKNKRR